MMCSYNLCVGLVLLFLSGSIVYLGMNYFEYKLNHQ